MGPGFESPMVHHKQPYGKRRAVFLLQFPGTLRRGASSEMRTADVRDVRGPPPTKVGGSRIRMNTLNLQRINCNRHLNVLK